MARSDKLEYRPFEWRNFGVFNPPDNIPNQYANNVLLPLE